MALRSRRPCSAAALAAFAFAAASAGARADTPTPPGPGPATSPDDGAKKEAQALVSDGVTALNAKQYDQALEKFLAAYDKFPSPKILLNIGSTLRDMGKLADAANTYERYLEDPSSGSERVGEVKQLLDDLDKKVGLLVVQVTPPGSDVSIDGGPWTTIGSSLTTRVDTGAHVVKAHKAGLEDGEASITAFEGKRTDIGIALKLKVAAEISTDTAAIDAHPVGTGGTAQPTGDNTNGWLITGPAAQGGRIRSHQGHSGTGDTPGDTHVGAVGPTLEHDDDHAAIGATAEPEEPARIEATAQARIDGKLRGAAFALGGDYDVSPELQVEAAMMFSKDLNGVIFGAYGGARYRFLGGRLRPLVGGGLPVFWSGGSARVGVRAGVGAEYFLNEHVSLLADLGVEHFFNPQSPYEATVFVPILGVHGRM
jgi:hypothetical protein